MHPWRVRCNSFENWEENHELWHYTGIDTGLEMDQSRPNLDLVKLVLDSATGKDEEEHAILTLADLAGCITRRRAESQKTNPKYTLSQYHEILQSLE